MYTQLTRIVDQLNAYNEKHPEHTPDFAPHRDAMTKEMNGLFYLNDVFSCFVYDLELLDDPRINAVLAKYHLQVVRDKNFPAMYANIQNIVKQAAAARAKKAKEVQNGEAPQVSEVPVQNLQDSGDGTERQDSSNVQ